jgi:hypothetical protein
MLDDGIVYEQHIVEDHFTFVLLAFCDQQYVDQIYLR